MVPAVVDITIGIKRPIDLLVGRVTRGVRSLFVEIRSVQRRPDWSSHHHLLHLQDPFACQLQVFLEVTPFCAKRLDLGDDNPYPILKIG